MAFPGPLEGNGRGRMKQLLWAALDNVRLKLGSWKEVSTQLIDPY